MAGYKELLSEHVEGIFKKYTETGLHICDIATGGGKSYTIGKLTCEYYSQHFDRIIILCVQNKLVLGMNQEIERFINNQEFIKPTDKLVVENNLEVTIKAIKEDSFSLLFEDMAHQIDNFKVPNKDLTYKLNTLKKTYAGLVGIYKTYENENNEFLTEEISDGEIRLRKLVRDFFDIYKKHLEHTGVVKKLSLENIHKLFPSLRIVYPQVDFKQKKLILMTIHKAMYGIDPIIGEKINISDFTEKKKRTLILFDESDQAAMAMRSTIIDVAIDNATGTKRFAKGYNGYLQYRDLIERHERMANNYYGNSLEKALNSALTLTNKTWEQIFPGVLPYKNIFLQDIQDIENYRRGVFFSGPIMRLNIVRKEEKKFAYVCYKNGDKHLTLAHGENDDVLKKEYNIVIPIRDFLSLINRNTTAIKTQFSKVIKDKLQQNRAKFEEEIKEIGRNRSVSNSYMGYPTLDREVHTLLSRFETTSEYQYELQIIEFIKNRKNIIVAEGVKMPDNSVYMQGVQLFQEELDELDNQHRVRISCREISTTPEKILIDLVNSENSSVVLCSATASSRSVVSNFDMEYISQVLGKKVKYLSPEELNTFDNLMAKTYPNKHKIEVVPIEHYIPQDQRPNHLTLPEKYKKMFSQTAQEDGSVDRWFRLTYKELNKNHDAQFHLYRIFQFIEAYYWFCTHDDIHSMIFFQNQTGDKNQQQINIISSLIDGTYREMSRLEDELPKNWKNSNICISKDWEEVDTKVLTELSKNKDRKIMLVSAYGSFKAGTNMQYTIPEGLDVLLGDNWEVDRSLKKKDWDAVYLQSPTSYLMMNEDGFEYAYEKSLYNAMLTLMMLYERGCLARQDVAFWLNMAISNQFWFSEKKNPGLWKDKAAWAQTIIEQAVGRLCRTKNKPHTTYILYDTTMEPLFDKANFEKSLTKEFRELAKSIIDHQNTEELNIENSEETIRCNNANAAHRNLERMRRMALKYSVKKDNVILEDDDIDAADSSDSIPYSVKAYQQMNQSYKQTIIKKPVINDITDLDDSDKTVTFIGKCYGDWVRDENNAYFFFYDAKNHSQDILPASTGKLYPKLISPITTRLELFMKNDVIRKYFEEHGYATTWPQGKLILHPRILLYDYMGEIGEEAFKAIVMHYCDVKESDFKHLEGKDYELADFILADKSGKYRIAFDVKNLHSAGLEDKLGDIPTAEKRKLKQERLKCPLITVNILKLNASTVDALYEIDGILNEDGSVIHDAIKRLCNYIHPDQND